MWCPFFKRIKFFLFLISTIDLCGSLFGNSDPYYIKFLIGYGLYGTGNIINSSGQGLELIERGINNGFLYSPVWSPIVDSYGPIYQNQAFHISSYSTDVQFYKNLNNKEYGFSINFFDLGFTSYIPLTFLNTRKLIPESNLYYPVTKEITKRNVLASVIQFDVFFNYDIVKFDILNLFIGGGIGIGYGRLAYSGPYVQEAHMIGNFGLKINLEKYLFIANLKFTGHTVKTGSSSFIDRRKVLVNPRRGEIIIATFQLGLGFPLTFNN